MVKASNAPLQIRLAEPVIFLRGPSTGTDFRGRPQQTQDGPPAMLRGLLTLRLQKPTRIRTVSATLEGKAKTEWPEGIGPRRAETFEEHTILSETATFFSAAEGHRPPVTRRSQSVDPAALAQYDLDSDEDSDDRIDDGRVIPRSASVLPGNEDWSSWRMARSRHASPDRFGGSRQASTLSLAAMRSSATQSRGLSPALTPADTPPPGSPLPRRTSGMNNSASSGDEDWRPRTPEGDPDNPINFPNADAQYSNGTSNPSTPGAVRFGEALSQVPSKDHDAHAMYHPAATHAQPCPTRAGTPTNETPPSASPFTRSPAVSRPPSLHDLQEANGGPSPGGRRSSGLRPPESPSMSRGPSSQGGDGAVEMRGRSRASSIIVRQGEQRHAGEPTGILLPSRTTTSTNSSTGPGVQHAPSVHHAPSFSIDADDRGRASHKGHKFSLSAALRSLSHHRNHSKSREPPSRSASRQRPEATPRNSFMALDDAPIPRISSGANIAMSRNSSSTGLQSLAPERGRSVETARGRSPGRRDESEHRGRSRQKKKSAFSIGGGGDEEVHNWKEFPKGTYNWPISFSIPPNMPPSIHAEFGSVVYKLKAHVVRAGALTTNLSDEMEVQMIAGPQEDDMEESDNVIVERQWEDQMRYQIALSGKAFPIGGTIPISIRLMPLAKCKVYRLTIALEEKSDYYASNKKVARHETPRRFVLFSAKNTPPNKHTPAEPLLPILSDDENAIKDSPLAPLARNAALNNPLEFENLANPEDDVYASLLDPLGPWHFEKDLAVPDCTTRLKFSSKHDQTNISVAHWLKVTIRVERGDDLHLDSKGKRKQFDIIIETPVKILDCRVNTQYNMLPSYERAGSDTPSMGCPIHGRPPPTRLGGSNLIGAASVGAQHAITAGLKNVHITHEVPQREPHGSHEGHEDTLLERNIVYDRLMSGQETEEGREPPSYGEAVANAIRSARSASRAASRATSPVGSRAASRAPSRNVSRVQLHIEE
ncbi:cyclin binding protein [Trichosporon asahii var. asahii CBS 2479]|uniref:Cyclin binding protein n=1 Tax=Trichosporon asahii var. asahii (strain ATCC 90039 / CBS 2479 / JCM 2466 / KCTC 7840 / NBRC 103889/ NCYC 2677 / UAMH 7654) TaxID=1186058 RepID=J5TIJ1_TRIAS|nr:cyclin binding protein [Trichosporon asahii var. asahii CBS 2479]EJT51081.1 cyclin binding protein [Trichosporon asahii var. asahii CBS 2479]